MATRRAMTAQPWWWAGASLTLLTACTPGGAGARGPAASDAEPVVVPTVAGPIAYADGVYVGPRVTNLRGGYQAQVTISGGIITAVDPVEAGTQDPESLQVNSFAVPELARRVIQAQSADVDYVSGSSFTSPAFLESIAGALDVAEAHA